MKLKFRIKKGEATVDKRELYDSFLALEENTQKMLARIDVMKQDMTKILEHNAELEIENQHLREHLQELESLQAQEESSKTQSQEPQLSKSRANLEKLYEEGFHVCNQFYGSRRENDEPCVFCVEVIYRER
jgi:regulator of replication initiation timing